MRTTHDAIQHFLETGDDDHLPSPRGTDWLVAAKQANQDLREALIAAVRQRVAGLSAPAIPNIDVRTLARNKLTPMVNGLFPAVEREPVLQMFDNSIVFLTAENINHILQTTMYLHTAWTLANLYLSSVSAELLSKTAPDIVGLSEGTTCYVSHKYFLEKDKFSDFVVHEAAHVFHNCKRATLGLPETRTREFLLNIDFHERETFAYACEAYSRILEHAHSSGHRLALVAEIEASIEKQDFPPEERVDIEKYRKALSEAARARNGWKKILRCCASASK